MRGFKIRRLVSADLNDNIAFKDEKYSPISELAVTQNTTPIALRGWVRLTGVVRQSSRSLVSSSYSASYIPALAELILNYELGQPSRLVVTCQPVFLFQLSQFFR